MRGEFELRVATPSDLPAILSLERNAFDAPHWTKKDYQAFVTAAGSERCLFVGTAGGRLAGFAAASVFGEEGELESIAVDGTYRRQGLGGALCRVVLEWCRVRDAGQVFLEVRAASTGVQQLYRQLGFEAVGRRPKYYRNPEDDALVMRLCLRQAAVLAARSSEV